MIQIDKIKLVTDISHIVINKEEYSKYDEIIKEGHKYAIKYTMSSPFELYLELNYEKSELVLEFTSKVLKDKYMQMINKNTFRECIENINNIGIGVLDIRAIESNSVVVKVDVTKDVFWERDDLFRMIKSHIRNYDKYLIRPHNKSNLCIEKNVSTKSRKRRLIIYDKAHEIQMAKNRSFISSLSQPAEMLDYFKGKTRFEINLNSMEQIRKCLKISKTDVESVLYSSSNPITDYLDELLDENIDCYLNEDTKLSLRDFERLNLLLRCDCDMAKVEQIVRAHSSKGTHISQALLPYKRLLQKYCQLDNVKFKNVIKSMLMEIIVVVIVSI